MAEFQKVIKERSRMCSCFSSCVDCPLAKAQKGNVICRDWAFTHPAETERVVMKWSEEHPILTNRRKFEEVFGFNIATMFEVNCRNADWLDAEYQETE